MDEKKGASYLESVLGLGSDEGYNISLNSAELMIPYEKLPLKIQVPGCFIFADRRGVYVASPPTMKSELPKISVFASTHPAAYELALISVWNHGTQSRTHYDQKDGNGNFLFPPSIEATVTAHVDNPLKEPRIHRDIPGGFEQLEYYRQEVVKGIHDSWIDPNDNKWTYSYHERFFDWNPSADLYAENRGVLLPQGVNQIEKLVEDLKRDLTSKGAQATTWMPSADPGLESNRPCLQRIWFRAYEEDDGAIGLNANWYFRSRDTKAWFMNGWALIDLARFVGDVLSTELDKPVNLRRISDHSDSLHFYGDFHKDFGQRYEKRGFGNDKDFENRVWRSDEEIFQELIGGERKRLQDNPHYKLEEDSQKRVIEKERELYEKRRGKNSWFSDHEHFMS